MIGDRCRANADDICQWPSQCWVTGEVAYNRPDRTRVQYSHYYTIFKDMAMKQMPMMQPVFGH